MATSGLRHGLIAVGLLAGCTHILGIDGEHDTTNASIMPGASGSGGSGGGTDGSAGIGAGGSAADGGGAGGLGPGACTAAVHCEPEQKCCHGQCVTPQALVGCSLDTCEVCPQRPDNGVVICEEEECAVRCNTGYLRVGDQCEWDPTDANMPDPPPMCDRATCTNGCTLASPIRCCKNDGDCGCTWALGAYCV